MGWTPEELDAARVRFAELRAQDAREPRHGIRSAWNWDLETDNVPDEDTGGQPQEQVDDEPA